jgi:hypothetical protein
MLLPRFFIPFSCPDKNGELKIMEQFQFNFCHPVEGLLKLFNKCYPGKTRIIHIHAKDGEVIDIPVEGLCRGLWKATLEWEYDGRDYYYEQVFEIL